MEQFQDMRETGLAGLDMCLVLLRSDYVPYR